MTIGCGLQESPQEIAVKYMNNLAFVQGMKAVFRYSFFAGTFGEYDLGAVPDGEIP